MRQILLAVVGMVAAPLVVVPWWIASHRGDAPAVADRDLDIEWRDLPPEENGFARLREAAERMHWPDGADERIGAVLRGAEDEAWVREMVARNAGARDRLEQALAAGAIELPHPLERWDDPGELRERADGDGAPGRAQAFQALLFGLQNLVRLSAAEAELEFAAGSQEGALASALVGMRLGHALAAATGTDLVTLMFASAIQGISLAAVERLVPRLTLDADASRRLARALDELRFRERDWARVWAAEYQTAKRSLLWAIREESEGGGLLVDGEEGGLWARLLGLVPRDYLWQENRTLARFAELYRGAQRAAAGPCARPGEAGSQRAAARWKILVSPNPVGELLVAIASPGSLGFEAKRCLLETRVSALQTVVALKAHHDARGELPGTLGALVPRFLGSLPVDAFGGAPLRYDAERAIVYSIGDDFQDQGGMGAETDYASAEPTFAVPI